MTLAPAYDNPGAPSPGEPGGRSRGNQADRSGEPNPFPGRASLGVSPDACAQARATTGELPAQEECEPDQRGVIQVIGENVCGRAWIYATLML